MTDQNTLCWGPSYCFKRVDYLLLPHSRELLIHLLAQPLRTLFFRIPLLSLLSPADRHLTHVNNMQARVMPGHRRAILSTVRYTDLWGLEEVYRVVGTNGRP